MSTLRQPVLTTVLYQIVIIISNFKLLNKQDLWKLNCWLDFKKFNKKLIRLQSISWKIILWLFRINSAEVQLFVSNKNARTEKSIILENCISSLNMSIFYAEKSWKLKIQFNFCCFDKTNWKINFNCVKT